MTFRQALQAVWALIQAFLSRFWPRPLETPAPSIPAPPLPQTQEAKTAIHEAGHMVAAWFCTYIDDIRSACIEAKGGEVQYTVVGADFAPILWCRMVIALAGVAAEAKVFKRWRSIEARDDLCRAREFSAKVIGTTPPWKALEAKQHLIEGAFTPKLSGDEAEAMCLAYAMARHLVSKHEVRLYKCAGMLLHRRDVTSADLTAAFGHRVFIRVASMTRGFWLP